MEGWISIALLPGCLEFHLCLSPLPPTPGYGVLSLVVEVIEGDQGKIRNIAVNANSLLGCKCDDK